MGHMLFDGKTKGVTNLRVFLILILSNLLIISCLNIFPQEEPNKIYGRANIEEILAKAGEYCRRLENAALDFVCLEEITERVRQSPQFRYESLLERADTNNPGIPRLRVIEKTTKNRYLYEYQLTREKEKSHEGRTLLEKNGKKKNQKDARLETSRLSYENVVFGPPICSGHPSGLLLIGKLLGKRNCTTKRRSSLKPVRSPRWSILVRTERFG